MTLVKPKSLRCVVFIDGQNLYEVLLKMNLRCDYKSLVRTTIDRFDFDVELKRVYYYSAYPDQNREPDNYRKTQGFLNALQQWDQWELRVGKLEYRDDGPVTKGVDIRLATDMISFAIQDLYDLALVVSGDADISYCFDTVKSLNKQIAVLSLPRDFSIELINKADFQLPFPNDICTPRER